jgi:transcriptional regulator with XRE-family HTH domain
VPSTIYSEEHRQLVALLRELREAAGLTQEELAVRLQRDQPWVSVVESGQRRIDLIELRDVCRALSMTLVEFVTTLESRLTGAAG